MANELRRSPSKSLTAKATATPPMPRPAISEVMLMPILERIMRMPIDQRAILETSFKAATADSSCWLSCSAR